MIGSLPLHPALVHFPIGIVLVLPFVTILLFFLIHKGESTRRALYILVFLHLLLMGSTFVAIETGEDQEHKVEQVVGESVLEEHEERAEMLMYGTVLAFLIVTGFTYFPLLSSNQTLSIMLSTHFILEILSFRVGHSGGELVYVHGAGSAYTGGNKASKPFPVNENSNRQSYDDD